MTGHLSFDRLYITKLRRTGQTVYWSETFHSVAAFSPQLLQAGVAHSELSGGEDSKDKWALGPQPGVGNVENQRELISVSPPVAHKTLYPFPPWLWVILSEVKK